MTKTANDGTPLPSEPNRSLPPLNPFFARSTIAGAIGVIQSVLAMTGAEGGIASVAAEIVANEDSIQTQAENVIRAVDVLIGVGSWVWFWFERRAPQARLSFRRN